MAEVLHDRRDPELFESRNLGRNQAENRAVAIGLFKKVAAKARCFVHFVGKIEVTAFIEDFPVRRSCDFAQHQDRFIAQDRLGTHRHDITVPPHFRGLAFPDMQIGSPFRHNGAQELIKISHLRLQVGAGLMFADCQTRNSKAGKGNWNPGSIMVPLSVVDSWVPD